MGDDDDGDAPADGFVLVRCSGAMNQHDGREWAFAVGQRHRVPFHPLTKLDRKCQRFLIEIPAFGQFRFQLIGIGKLQLGQRFVFDRETNGSAGTLMNPRGLTHKQLDYAVTPADSDDALAAMYSAASA